MAKEEDKKNVQEDEANTVDPEQLEKSWDESVAALREHLGESSEEDKGKLEKAGKVEKAKPKDEDDDDEEEDEEEEEMEYSKSLPDRIAGDDPEAEVAMDVEPFLKSLAVGIQGYIDSRFTKLEKAYAQTEELSKVQARALLTNMELQKATRDMVRKIGEEPIPSGSKLQKGGVKRFGVDEQKLPSITDKRKILDKSFELLKAGKIDHLQATKIEGRVNKNQPLPVDVADLFEEEAS